MFLFLCVFGPAAITYLVAHHCLGQTSGCWYEALIEMICFAVLDTVITLCVMLPLHWAELIFLPSGQRELLYSGRAFFGALVIGVVCGVVFAAVRKRLELRVEVEPQKKDGSDEEKESA